MSKSEVAASEGIAEPRGNLKYDQSYKVIQQVNRVPASKKRKVIHYPRLDTVLMVEAFIQEHDGEFARTRLWRRLPKGVMYQTFRVVIDYLLYSGKISIDAEGKVGWVFYPAEARRDLKLKNLFWKPPR